MYIIYVHVFPNGKKYVGATKEKLYRRFGKNGCNYRAKKMKEAIEKYGWDNIQHIILENKLDYNTAIEKEKFYISLFKTDDPKFGYNTNVGGGFSEVVNQAKFRMTEKRRKWYEQLKGTKFSEDTKLKMKESHTDRLGKDLYQYKDGEIVNKWASVCELCRQTGYGKALICRVAKYNETHENKHSAYGYIWIYKKRDQ